MADPTQQFFLPTFSSVLNWLTGKQANSPFLPVPQMQSSLLMWMARGAAAQADLTQLPATGSALPGRPFPCPGPHSTMSLQPGALHTSQPIPAPCREVPVHTEPQQMAGQRRPPGKQRAKRGTWAAEQCQRLERDSVLLWEILSLLRALATHMKKGDNSCSRCLP